MQPWLPIAPVCGIHDVPPDLCLLLVLYMCWRWQQLDELPTKVRGLFSQNPQEQYEATQWFRKLLSIGEPTCTAAGCLNSKGQPALQHQGRAAQR